jgi:hypothetical protein
MPAPVAEIATFEPFIQLLRGGLQRLRQAHPKLTAHQERLLVELVSDADYLTHEIRNVTVTGWAEYLGESRNTTAKSFTLLCEAGLIVCASDLKSGRGQAGYVVTITEKAWLELVKPKRKKAERVPVDNSQHRANVLGDNSEPRADVRDPRADVRDPRADVRALPAKTDPHIPDIHISAKGGGISEESDPVREKLERVFPKVATSTILDSLKTLRSEGITEETLKTATEQAAGAKASSLHAWFMPRARSLHNRESNSQSNQPTRPAEKQGSPWCEFCHMENGVTILKDTCKHSRALQVVKDSQGALVAV